MQISFYSVNNLANTPYSSAVAALDGSVIPGGALNKNGWQIL
jgi:hypothetical protein